MPSLLIPSHFISSDLISFRPILSLPIETHSILLIPSPPITSHLNSFISFHLISSFLITSHPSFTPTYLPTSASLYFDVDDFGLTSKTQDNATPILSERKVDQDTVAVEKTSPPSRNQPTDILQDVTQLRPVIVSGADEEARGFSHNSSVSIPQLNQALPFPADINGTAREQQGISLSRRAGGDYAKPVLGNLDVFQARQTGFPSHSSKGFEFPETQELAPHSIVQERDLFRESISPLVKHEIPTSPSASKGLGHLASRVNESHGFSLKPVADILDSAEGSSEDETPPADSLKGIKSIAEQRRQLQKKTKVKAGHGRDAKQGSPKVPLRVSKSGQGEKREKNSEGGRVRKAKSTAKQEVVGDRSRFGWRNSPVVTPSRGTRGITGKERKEKVKCLVK